MIAVILAGGLGTRLSEETTVRPKPMVEIGDRPILWHIMKIYAHHGVKDFVILLGYKGDVIKSYFLDFARIGSDLTVDVGSGKVTAHSKVHEDWRITLVDTGRDTMTGGRLKRAQHFLQGKGPFLMTYGDGVGDVDITQAIKHHKKAKRLATVTAVRPPGRFGVLGINGDGIVGEFREKEQTDEGWINGGFFVLEPKVFSYIDGDATIWEQEPLRRLAADGQLAAYKHEGFWSPMDTTRDRDNLRNAWESGNAPWNVWDPRDLKDKAG